MNCRYLLGAKGTHFCSISRTHSRFRALVFPSWLGIWGTHGASCLSLVAYLVFSCGAAKTMAPPFPSLAAISGQNRSTMLNYRSGEYRMWSEAPRSSLVRIQVKIEVSVKGHRWDTPFSKLLTVLVGRMILRMGEIRRMRGEWRTRDWTRQNGQAGRAGLGRRERE